MTGTIFNIQHFCLQDGPGIRTTVFFKCCPLRCAWCHNPESYRAKPELMTDASRCIGCGACRAVCEHQADHCIQCGKCAAVCVSGARELCGKTASVEEIIEQLERQRIFYGENGGLTLSGGEPTAQPDFAIALAKEAKARSIGVCVETCGYCEFTVLETLSQFTDLFLYDFKLMDEALHKQYTGVSNRRILDNLRRLDTLGKPIILRCPMIPGVNVNETHLKAVAQLAGELQHVREIQLEPYHPLGLSKAARLGLQPAYTEEKLLDPKLLADLVSRIHSDTKITIQ